MAAAAGRVAVPLGALACQKDSFLQTLQTVVLSCSPVSVPGTKKQPPQTFYELELQDTVLYPEGGGQPWDTGLVSGVPVERVYVKDGRCIHRIAPAADGSSPFQQGQQVVANVDWTRRFDHMQQHSGQHLLSAIAGRHGFKTTSSSISELRSNVDLVSVSETKDAERKTIAMTTLLEIEREVNAEILNGRSMTPQYVAPGTPEWDAIAAKFVGKEEKAHVMRIMCIDGIDVNPCGGTHVSNLTQLRSLRILSTESSCGATRVWFVAGERVNREFARMLQREQVLTKVLSCGPDEHASRLDKLLESQKLLFKDVKAAQNELAEAVAKDLLAQCGSQSSSGVVLYHRIGGDLAFLQTVLSHLDAVKDSVVIVLAVSQAQENEGIFLLAGPAAFIAQHGKQLAQVINGKGGGRNGVFQGKAKALGRLDEMVAMLKELCP